MFIIAFEVIAQTKIECTIFLTLEHALRYFTQPIFVSRDKLYFPVSVILSYSSFTSFAPS